MDRITARTARLQVAARSRLNCRSACHVLPPRCVAADYRSRRRTPHHVSAGVQQASTQTAVVHYRRHGVCCKQNDVWAPRSAGDSSNQKRRRPPVSTVGDK